MDFQNHRNERTESMAKLEHLQPRSVFHYFEEICQIPHGSGNIDQISDYLAGFARERGLEYYQDEVKNVIIIKEAAPGYENEEPILLQGHMDMVAIQRPDCPRDMTKEGLDLVVEGDWLRAEGTSLGGDDGIAVAYGLALLEAQDIPHPRLEVIITVNEETGMDGANGIDLSVCKGHTMINLDNEEEGVLLTSCAGGARVGGFLPINWEKKEGLLKKVNVTGLLGGHSGAEIDKGRANANVLLGRLTMEVRKNGDIRLVSLSGGSAANAIPAVSEATFWMAEEDAAEFERTVGKLEAVLQKEYAVKDPGVKLEMETVSKYDEIMVFSEETTERIMTILCLMPNGIHSMSAAIPGLVQTSMNLGVMKIEDDRVILEYSVRSSVDSEKESLKDKAFLLLTQMGAEAELGGDYPAWEYRAQSPLRERMAAVYEEMFGCKPAIQAIHAGLECGILSTKLPDLDCISIGPDMKDIHTPEERLSISSTERMWNYLLAVLACKNRE